MNLSKVLKKKRDAEARARALDPAKNVIYKEGSGYADPGNSITAAEHALIDHSGLTGVPAAETFTEAVHDLRDHEGLPGVPSSARGIAFTLYETLAVEEDALGIEIDKDLIVTGGKLSVSTAPTGADLICDINKNGDTMFTTQGNRPTIAVGNTSAVIAAPDITGIAKGDRITLDIDQVGLTAAGAKLSLTLYCEEA